MKNNKRNLLLVILIILVYSIIKTYNSGIPVEELKNKYLYPESKFLAFEGMNIHYRKTGEGPALILLHGVSSSLHTWEVWQEKLSKNYTVITLDVPSFGLTGPHPKADYSVDMYMRMLDFVSESLKIDSLIIGGNSFGGFLSWNYAIHQPIKVNKLVLLNSAGFETSDFKDIGFTLMANPITAPITAVFTPKYIVKKSVKNVYGDQSLVTDKLVQRYYDLLLRNGNRKAFSSILQNIDSRKSTIDELSKITQPTLIIWGDQDRLLTVDFSTKFKKHIKNSQLHIFKGVGHVPMEEIPEKSVAIVQEFLLNSNIN